MDLYRSVGNAKSAKKLFTLFKTGLNVVFLDFDHTMTSTAGLQSWSKFTQSPKLSTDTKVLLNTLYDIHMPVELSPHTSSLDKAENAKQWYSSSLPALSSAVKTVSDLKIILDTEDGDLENPPGRIILKPGVEEFLNELRDRKIPCIVFSGGIGDVVRRTLTDLDPDAFGVHIVSNFMIFSEIDEETQTMCEKYSHHCTESDSEFLNWSKPTITSANKCIQTLVDYWTAQIKDKKNQSETEVEEEISDIISILYSAQNILLVGDMISDANMCFGVPGISNVFKVGFYSEEYDKQSAKSNDDCEIVKKPFETYKSHRAPILGEKYYGNAPQRLCGVSEYLISNESFEDNNTRLEAMSRSFDVVLDNSPQATFDPISSIAFGFSKFEDNNIEILDICKDSKQKYAETLCNLMYHKISDTVGSDMVSVSGYARSGKDTYYSTLSKVVLFEQISYADALRDCTTSLNPWIRVPGEDRVVRYNDLLSTIGYDEMKTKYPDVRKFLISIGHGVRTNINEDSWLKWAFNRDLQLFEVVDEKTSFAQMICKTFLLFNQLESEKQFIAIDGSDSQMRYVEFVSMVKSKLLPTSIAKEMADYEKCENLALECFTVMAHDLDSDDGDTNPYDGPISLPQYCVLLAKLYDYDEYYGYDLFRSPVRRSIKLSVMPKIITDARYHNERQFAYVNGGFLVYVRKTGVDAASETERKSLENSYYNAIIDNDSTIENYEQTILMTTVLKDCYMSLSTMGNGRWSVKIPTFNVKSSSFE